MLNEAKLPDVYWREAVYIVVYILNRGHLKIIKTKPVTNYGMKDLP